MTLLKKIGLGAVGCIALLAVGIVPDVLSTLVTAPERAVKSKDERWLVNVEADGKKDTSYFYANAIINADTIKTLIMADSTKITGFTTYTPSDEYNEISAERDNIDYTIKLVKQQ